MEAHKKPKQEHLTFDTDFLKETTSIEKKLKEETVPSIDQTPVSVGNNSIKPKSGWYDKKAAFFTVIAVVGLIVWGAIQNSIPWVDFTSASGHFKAQFPTQPVYEKSDNYESYTSKSTGKYSSDYAVFYSSLAGVGTIKDPSTFLSAVKDEFFSSGNDMTVISSTPSYFGTYHSLDVKIKYSTKGEYMKVRMILTNDMLYLVSSDYFTENSTNDDKFFKSFQVIN